MADDTASTGRAGGASGSGSGSRHAVTARTKARRRAVEILFEADQRGLLRSGDGEAGSGASNPTEAPAYTRTILAGVADHLAEDDEILETYAQGWTLARMPAVDRAVARIATWEIVWNDEVDAPVAINEAMTLGRMLSTDDSPRFLNGLLGRIGDLADTLR